jgi:hypothetical protein
MLESTTRKLQVAIGTLSITAIGLLGLVLGPAQATAGTFGFCENQLLAGGQGCVGGQALMYQDYGWGDNHSVCVQLEPETASRRCSGGAEQGVYSGSLEEWYWYPTIENNASGSNRVHGVYFTH